MRVLTTAQTAAPPTRPQRGNARGRVWEEQAPAKTARWWAGNARQFPNRETTKQRNNKTKKGPTAYAVGALVHQLRSVSWNQRVTTANVCAPAPRTMSISRITSP